MFHSAGDHTYKEIHIRIWPYGDRATVSVHTRRKRGLDVVWERHLGSVGVDVPEGTDNVGLAGILRLCAQELLNVATQADK